MARPASTKIIHPRRRPARRRKFFVPAQESGQRRSVTPHEVTFVTIRHSAISYLHHGYPREEMVALMLAADIMLVTALRDGMNLVAKAYVATRVDDDGVLVLS